MHILPKVEKPPIMPIVIQQLPPKHKQKGVSSKEKNEEPKGTFRIKNEEKKYFKKMSNLSSLNNMYKSLSNVPPSN